MSEVDEILSPEELLSEATLILEGATHDGLSTLDDEQMAGRLATAERLTKRYWYAQTDSQLREELITLPANHAGYLEDLADRPEEMGGVVVDKLHTLARGNFAITSIFDVENSEGTKYQYEYVSWRQGPMSGAKGIVLLGDEETNEPSHLLTLQGEKFATGGLVGDLPGGFIEGDGINREKLNDAVARELREEVSGEIDLSVTSIDILGYLQIDPGMTNNRPALFVARMVTPQIASVHLIAEEQRNTDKLELQASIVVTPLERLSEFVGQTEDSFTLSAISKAVATGHIPAEYLAS